MAYPCVKYKYYLILLFIAVITYLAGSLHYNFEYLDFGYLIVTIVCLIRFLKIKDRN
ncbi:MAG: hypothetical protein PHI22_01760 [Bacilli bacterium]|nr:hypothetical protein [Bacilli bacterium]MDD4298029.1 hypothetical protein [Bacilli bacterium]MDD4643682.1 hypothetical protein [Bacilli bacterium]